MTETTEYFYRIPTINEMIEEIRDARKRKGKIAIIVSAKRDNERLRYFLKRLTEQTYKDFDVIIVYGESDDFLKDFEQKLSILHVRRKKDLGFVGGIFLGQVICYLEDYEMFMLFDSDRAFSNEKSLKKLVEGIGNKEICCGISFDVSSKQPHASFLVLGSLFKRKVMEKIGFYYAPLWMGFDDSEYSLRVLEHNIPVKFIDDVITFHRELNVEESKVLSFTKCYVIPTIIGLLKACRYYPNVIQYQGCEETKHIWKFLKNLHWIKPLPESDKIPDTYKFFRILDEKAKIAIKAIVIYSLIKLLSRAFFVNVQYAVDESFMYLCKNRYIYPSKRFEVEKDCSKPLPELFSTNETGGFSFLKRWLNFITFMILFSYYRGKVCIKVGDSKFATVPKKEIPWITYFFTFPYRVIKWFFCAKRFAEKTPSPIEIYNVKNVMKLKDEWKEIKKRFRSRE